MKTTSRLALVAATGLLIGTGSWSLSARAADLGGDCCSDLEERVAELEATTVRKGNRKVSLELSGQIDRALLAWNDGRDSDVYSLDNSWSSSRIRVKGTGQMMPGWKAGFYYELEFRDAASNTASQVTETGGRGTDSASLAGSGSLRERQSNVFVESDKFGRVTLGLQNMATKDITLINLSGSFSDPENYWSNAFKVRTNSTTALGGLTWGNFWNALDAQRIEAVRYDTPSLFGFVASAAFGQNDVWDVALRYQKEWNSIRIAAGVGYAWYGENFCGSASVNNTTVNGTCTPDGETASQAIQPGTVLPTRSTGTKTEVVTGTISAIHVPTGLYANFVAGNRHIDNPAFNTAVISNSDASYWYLQAGISKRFFDVGATTIFGEYGDYKDFAVGDASPFGIGGAITGDDTQRWGVGFTQAFDGAALELYTNYQHMSVDMTQATGAANPKVLDMDLVYSGARIKF